MIVSWLAGAPSAHGIGHALIEPKLQYKTDLKGGLRSETEVHHYGYDLVVKRANYQEIVRQDSYLRSLPPALKEVFIPFISFDQERGTDQGVVRMPYYPGRSLQEILVGTEPLKVKRFALNLVLKQLSNLHVSRDNLISLSGGYWVSLIEGRVLPRLLPHMDQSISRLKHLCGRGLGDKTIAGSIIHGDAQAGNILVSQLHQVRFIDPLGGSGESPGDPLYDYSRLYHWVDVAGACAVIDNIDVETDVARLIDPRLSEVVSKFAINIYPSMSDKFWFYLYAAFHLAGKFHNFKHPRAVYCMQVQLQKYLKLAVKYLESIDEDQ